jgi:hypothetical protein
MNADERKWGHGGCLLPFSRYPAEGSDFPCPVSPVNPVQNVPQTSSSRFDPVYE